MSQTTRIVHVSPVTAAGAQAPGYSTARTTAKGSCEPGSEAIGQAYRCFAGNAVYDPCWAERAAAPTVVCLAEPWLRTDTVMTLAALPPAIPGVGTNLAEPWGVQLASGQRCLLAQGAHTVFQGKIVDFDCGAGLVLLRGLDEQTRPWIAQGVLVTSGALRAGPREKIVIAWYGRPDRTR